MQVCVVSFKRTERGKREIGVAVSKVDNCGGELDVIIDADGKPVENPLWTYQSMEYAGCFIFNPKQY